jgi:hypothetical protein
MGKSRVQGLSSCLSIKIAGMLYYCSVGKEGQRFSGVKSQCGKRMCRRGRAGCHVRVKF